MKRLLWKRKRLRVMSGLVTLKTLAVSWKRIASWHVAATLDASATQSETWCARLLQRFLGFPL